MCVTGTTGWLETTTLSTWSWLCLWVLHPLYWTSVISQSLWAAVQKLVPIVCFEFCQDSRLTINDTSVFIGIDLCFGDLELFEVSVKMLCDGRRFINHSLNIPVGSADFTSIILELTFLALSLWGEYTSCPAAETTHTCTVPIFVPPGTHYCWVARTH